MLISHLVLCQEQFYFIHLGVFVIKKWLNAFARDGNMKCYIIKVDPLKVHTHHWLFKLYKFARMCSLITEPYACKHDIILVTERKRKKAKMAIVSKGGVVDQPNFRDFSAFFLEPGDTKNSKETSWRLKGKH